MRNNVHEQKGSTEKKQIGTSIAFPRVIVGKEEFETEIKNVSEKLELKVKEY